MKREEKCQKRFSVPISSTVRPLNSVSVLLSPSFRVADEPIEPEVSTEKWVNCFSKQKGSNKDTNPHSKYNKGYGWTSLR